MAIPLKSQPQPLSDLNTTPLIDVLLVLLIMFIITMPLQTQAVKIDLPGAGPSRTTAIEQVRNSITIDAAGMISWNGQAVDRAALRSLLGEMGAMPIQPDLHFRPAAEARYEIVDAVLADIKRAGVTKLSLPGNEAYQAF
jgi:biopolymer transport protein ExbD